MTTHGVIYGGGDVRLFELTPNERLSRIFKNEDIYEISMDAVGKTNGDKVLFCSADHVVDIALIRAMAKAENTLLVEDGCVIMAVLSGSKTAEAVEAINAGDCFKSLEGTRVITRYQLDDLYNDALRKRGAPFIEPVFAERQKDIEWVMYNGAYKGVTDFLTKYAWRHLAFHITRFCAKVGLHPNVITIVGLVLTVLAAYHFTQGQYALGLIEGWTMMVLDTVDGKLARVTITSSAIGNVLDHGNDLIHPPFWWWAWLVGLSAYGTALEPEIAMWVFIATFGGYIVGRVAEGLFIATFGMDIHVWRSLDSKFRLITARRNPNIFMLTIALMFGRPDFGIVLVAAWTIISILFYVVRYFYAAIIRMTKGKGAITSWLDQADSTS